MAESILPPEEWVAKYNAQAKESGRLPPTADYAWAYFQVLGDRDEETTNVDPDEVIKFLGRMQRARAGEPD